MCNVQVKLSALLQLTECLLLILQRIYSSGGLSTKNCKSNQIKIYVTSGSKSRTKIQSGANYWNTYDCVTFTFNFIFTSLIFSHTHYQFPFHSSTFTLQKKTPFKANSFLLSLVFRQSVRDELINIRSNEPDEGITGTGRFSVKQYFCQN